MGFLANLWAFVRARYVFVFTCFVALCGFAYFGLKSDLWLARSLGMVPYRYQVIQTPSQDYVPGVIKMIESARRELVIATGRIDDEGVLRALQDAEKRGVWVGIVFSPDQVRRDQGCLGWLLKHGVGSVWTDTASFSGVTLVVDGSVALVSHVPIYFRTKASTIGGLTMLIRHHGAVDELRTSIETQAKRGTEMQRSKYRTNDAPRN